MRKRLAVISAGILAALMALGTANALVLDTATGSGASQQAVAGEQTVFDVGDAGSVTLLDAGTTLEVVSVEQAAGWKIEIEVASGREVEVDFSNGTRRIQFNAELEDGEIRVRAREQVVAATSTTQTTTRSTTSTTAAAVASSSATGTMTYQAGAAGTVTISNDGSRLTITAVDAADGWSHEIEVSTGREVEMDFRNGDDRVQFNAELEDGQVRVRVRTRAADGSRTEVTNGVDTSADDSSSSEDDRMDDSSSSDDEDDDRDDRSSDSDDDHAGGGHSDDEGDNSGWGSSDDDHSSDD